MNVNANPQMNGGMMMNGMGNNMGQMANNQQMQPNHMQQNQQRQVRLLKQYLFHLFLFQETVMLQDRRHLDLN